MKKALIAFLLAAVLLMVACTQASNDYSVSQTSPSVSPIVIPSPIVISTPKPMFTAENYPIMDGSTANLPLMASVYSKLTGTALSDAEAMVSCSTTSPAWQNLLNESADILIVYEASQSVKKQIEEADVELEITPLGRDALVFIANTNNPVESLTQQQILNIYTGNITNWSELGGNDTPIVAFQRNEESGSQTLFKKLVSGDTPLMDAPQELKPGFMGGLVDGLASYDGGNGAIGYSVYYYINEMYSKPNLKLIGVDSVMPTNETIKDNSYPFTNEFFVAIRKNEPADSPARLLKEWLLSEEGTKALVEAGYVPVN